MTQSKGGRKRGNQCFEKGGNVPARIRLEHEVRSVMLPGGSSPTVRKTSFHGLKIEGGGHTY
jgi:hypothetical protein